MRTIIISNLECCPRWHTQGWQNTVFYHKVLVYTSIEYFQVLSMSIRVFF